MDNFPCLSATPLYNFIIVNTVYMVGFTKIPSHVLQSRVFSIPVWWCMVMLRASFLLHTICSMNSHNISDTVTGTPKWHTCVTCVTCIKTIISVIYVCWIFCRTSYHIVHIVNLCSTFRYVCYKLPLSLLQIATNTQCEWVFFSDSGSPGSFWIKVMASYYCCIAHLWKLRCSVITTANFFSSNLLVRLHWVVCVNTISF